MHDLLAKKPIETQSSTARDAVSGSLFRTKSIDRLTAESGNTPLKRTLGPWSLVALGIGAIIGAGLFVRTAYAIAQRSAPEVSLAFIPSALRCPLPRPYLPDFVSMI